MPAFFAVVISVISHSGDIVVAVYAWSRSHSTTSSPRPGPIGKFTAPYDDSASSIDGPPIQRP